MSRFSCGARSKDAQNEGRNWSSLLRTRLQMTRPRWGAWPGAGTTHHSRWSVHCCRKIEKSVQNLGNINLVITIRPDYRYRSIFWLDNKFLSIFLSWHAAGESSFVWNIWTPTARAELELKFAQFIGSGGGGESPDNICTFVQYLILSPRQELCSGLHSCCKIALDRKISLEPLGYQSHSVATVKPCLSDEQMRFPDQGEVDLNIYSIAA